MTNGALLLQDNMYAMGSLSQKVTLISCNTDGTQGWMLCVDCAVDSYDTRRFRGIRMAQGLPKQQDAKGGDIRRYCSPYSTNTKQKLIGCIVFVVLYLLYLILQKSVQNSLYSTISPINVAAEQDITRTLINSPIR